MVDKELKQCVSEFKSKASVFVAKGELLGKRKLELELETEKLLSEREDKKGVTHLNALRENAIKRKDLEYDYLASTDKLIKFTKEISDKINVIKNKHG